MFTPKELQEKTFDKAVFGGYDMQRSTSSWNR